MDNNELIRRIEVLENNFSNHYHNGNDAKLVNFMNAPIILKPRIDATNPSALIYTPSASGTATLNLNIANEHRITMPAGNITIALSSATNAQKFIISITQDSTGSRTVTWFPTIKWVAGTTPTLTTIANKRDTFGCIRTGVDTYDGFIIGQNL